MGGMKKGQTCGLPEEVVHHLEVAVLVANEVVEGLRVGFRREFSVLNCSHSIADLKGKGAGGKRVKKKMKWKWKKK